MCVCLNASQAILGHLARQFGILAALFFLLGIVFSLGLWYGVELFKMLYRSYKSRKKEE